MIDLMILFVLMKRDFTMYGIHKRINDKFLPFSTPSFGAIKPALVRLEKKGCLTTSKIMSDGGKLSVYYTITDKGLKDLKEMLLKPITKNPLQFISEAKIRLCCSSFLSSQDAKSMFLEIKSIAMLHKTNSEKLLSDEYNPIDFYQKIVLDNTVCEYKNFISMLEGLEKNAGNS